MLDLGTASSTGGNTFGGMTQADRNGVAGIMLCGAPLSQLADGDSWSTCQPTQTPFVCGGAVTGGYTDVAYQYAGTIVSTGGPISGTCSIGP